MISSNRFTIFIILHIYFIILCEIFFQAIKHKLQIKTNKAIADGGASPQEEDKARMLFGSKLVVNMSNNNFLVLNMLEDEEEKKGC